VIEKTKKQGQLASGAKKRSHYIVARVLHWATAYFIAMNLTTGWPIGGLRPGEKEPLAMIHASMGTTILLLMLFRWWWRKSRELYRRPKWWKKPRTLVQRVFFPLLSLQIIFGAMHAAFSDYEVVAFGFINYSAIAADNPGLHDLFLQAHGVTAVLLAVLIIYHGVAR